jgi:hypothetical protein
MEIEFIWFSIWMNSFEYGNENQGARSSVVCWGTILQVAGSCPDVNFFNWLNHSSLTMALGSTQPLTEMNTRNLPGGKGRPVRKADKRTAIWEPRRLTTQWAFTICYRDSFIIIFFPPF